MLLPKGEEPILVTLAGRAIVDCGRPVNALLPTVVSRDPAPKVTEAKDVLALKALLPNEVKLLGRLIEVSPARLKADVPID
jgi:hypothetical protein